MIKPTVKISFWWAIITILIIIFDFCTDNKNDVLIVGCIVIVNIWFAASVVIEVIFLKFKQGINKDETSNTTIRGR